MEDGIRAANEIPECEVHVAIPHLHFSKKSGEVPQWTNGQCVLAVPTSCKLCLKFDIPKCRTLLERFLLKISTGLFKLPWAPPQSEDTSYSTPSSFTSSLLWLCILQCGVGFTPLSISTLSWIVKVFGCSVPQSAWPPSSSRLRL